MAPYGMQSTSCLMRQWHNKFKPYAWSTDNISASCTMHQK